MGETMNKLIKPCDMPVAVPAVYRVILNDKNQWIGDIKKRDGKYIVSFCNVASDDYVSKTFAGMRNAFDAAQYGCREDFLSF